MMGRTFPVDLGRLIREHLRRALEEAEREGRVNIAAATNIEADDEVTIVIRREAN